MQSPAMCRSLRPSSPSQRPWPSMLPWMPLICWRLLGCAVFTMGLWDHGCHLRSQWMWNSDVQKELKDRCKSPYNMRKYAKHRRWTRDLHRRSARNRDVAMLAMQVRHHASQQELCWFLCWWKITPAAWSAWWSQDPKKKDYRWYGLDLTNGTVRNQVRFWKFLVLQMCFSRSSALRRSCVSVASDVSHLSASWNSLHSVLFSDLQWRVGANGLQIEVFEVCHRGSAVTFFPKIGDFVIVGVGRIEMWRPTVNLT